MKNSTGIIKGTLIATTLFASSAVMASDNQANEFSVLNGTQPTAMTADEMATTFGKHVNITVQGNSVIVDKSAGRSGLHLTVEVAAGSNAGGVADVHF